MITETPVELWKVGELARRTGLTVRTLHHYDEIGLLSPSRRSGSGYRLYDADDVERLQRIVSLRHIGMTLDEIRRVLSQPEYSLPKVLELQISRLAAHIATQQELRLRLSALLEQIQGAGPVPADAFFTTIEATHMYEKYYTAEQLATLKARAEALGEEQMKAVQEEWPRLIAAVREHMERGTPPSDPAVRQLGQRWSELVAAFTGGDPGIARSLRTLYENEPQMRTQTGVDPALTAYVAAAQG